jgi:hypothetical protein
LTRASIHLRKTLQKEMDCRVKPGNDDQNTAILILRSGRLAASRRMMGTVASWFETAQPPHHEGKRRV